MVGPSENPKMLSPEELSELTTRLLSNLEPRILSALERAARENIKGHACPFEERRSLLSAVANYASRYITPQSITRLDPATQLELATYIYHFIDHCLNWENTWGATFNAREMKLRFESYLRDMESYLPSDAVILDVGSGIEPLGKILLGHESSSRRLVAIDIAAPSERPTEGQMIMIRLDINLITEATSAAVDQAMSAAESFTGRQPLKVDVVVLSDILNYVDAEGVLAKLMPMINRGGFLAICSHAGVYTSPTYLHGGSVDLTKLWPTGRIPGFNPAAIEVCADPLAEGQKDAIAIFCKT